MQSDKILDQIIECGKSETFSELETLFPNWQKYQDFMHLVQEEIKSSNKKDFMHYYEIFALLGDNYDFEKLTCLIKGLTIVENKVKMGSVSPVIALYKNLVEKAGLLYLLTGDKMGVLLLTKHLADKPHKGIEDITQWILEKSNNVYLPFGISTLHSRTLTDIKIEVENWKQRQQELVIREEIEKAQKEERNEKRKVEIENHDKEHHDRTEEQRKIREQLNKLTVSQLLQTISADKQRPIYFYAKELCKIENQSLTTEDNDLIKELLKKFKVSETGQFKRLKLMLSSTLGEKKNESN